MKNEFNFLELLVVSRLDYLKIQAEYKSLVKNISHDITSPLRYLENSLEILNLQLVDITDKEVKETVKVITNSTSKLTKDSQLLTIGDFSEIEKDKQNKTPREVINFCLVILKLHDEQITLRGDLEQELMFDSTLIFYVLSLYIDVLIKNKIQLESITINQKEGNLYFKISCNKTKINTLEDLQQDINSKKDQKTLNALNSFLKVEVEFEKSSKPCLGINFSSL